MVCIPKGDGDNLRPISLLPTLDKILDKIEPKRLAFDLKREVRFSDYQLGFRKCRTIWFWSYTDISGIRQEMQNAQETFTRGKSGQEQCI